MKIFFKWLSKYLLKEPLFLFIVGLNLGELIQLFKKSEILITH